MSTRAACRNSPATENQPAFNRARHLLRSGAGLPAALILLAGVFALASRLPFLGYESGDYRNFVSPWFQTLKVEGIAALGTPFSDYSPAYLHLLWLATYLPVFELLAVKAMSIPFDVLLGVAAARSCGAAGGSRLAVAGTFSAVVCAPTVVLNSAAWGQCDAIYASLAVLAIAFVLRGRSGLAMLALGCAIAFKAQAAFILPFFLVASLRGSLSPRAWLLVPVPFVAFAAVPLLAGYPPRELALIYVSQSEKYQQLTLNAPTLFAFVDARQGVGQPAMLAGGLAVLGVTFAAARWARLARPVDWLPLATMFAVLVPFVLPRMHERYFFMADVLAIACGFAGAVRWWVPAAIVTSSLCSYLPFLFGFEIVPLWFSAGLMAAALASLLATTFPALGAVPERARNFARCHRTSAVRFATVGIASTLACLVLYLALRVALNPATANLTALGMTMAFNFQANRAWSFRGRTRSLKMEAPAFLLVYATGLAASALTLELALRTVGQVSRAEELVLVFGSSGVATITRFWLLSLLVYRRPVELPTSPV